MNNRLYQTSKFSPWRFMKVQERLMHHPDHQRKGVVPLPPTVLVLFSILSVQLGAALAKSLFPAIGSGGTVFLRVGLAALVLLLVWRPHLRAYTRAHYALVGLFGLNIAAMNAAFYAAIARIPLGIAVTLEFVGPLGVAFVASRRRSDLLWAGLAAGGHLTGRVPASGRPPRPPHPGSVDEPPRTGLPHPSVLPAPAPCEPPDPEPSRPRHRASRLRAAPRAAPAATPATLAAS